MKKSLLALAALTAFAGVAYAQSSVTLFGVVDVSAKNSKTGSTTLKSLAKNGTASSRIGLRGVEDMGGGLKAGFWIEGDTDPDTGTPGGQQWQRRSTVSLMGGFGELRLGRDYTPSFWNYTVFDPFGTNGVASMLQAVGVLGSGATTLVRANNTVGYFLPAAGGLYGQAMVAAGEGVTGNKYFGGRIGYSGGPVNVAVAMGKTDRTGAMTDDYTDANVGASFKMGAFTLMGSLSKRDYANADEKTAQIGGVLAMGAGLLKLSFVKTDGATSAADIKIIGAGYDHSLSKRTALYGTVAKVDRVPANTDTTAYEVGIRHVF